jgi:hypothetical protein
VVLVLKIPEDTKQNVNVKTNNTIRKLLATITIGPAQLHLVEIQWFGVYMQYHMHARTMTINGYLYPDFLEWRVVGMCYHNT